MKNILFVFILLACLDAAAQGAVPPLSKITITDLAEKVHPQDSTAAAAFLQRRGKTWFELSGNTWFMLTEVYVRVKIYNKEGYSYANPEITFYSGDKLAKGYFGEANTYNLKGGILEKTSFDKATEHEKVIRENVTQKKITLPNVREGSIIEYKYTVTTPYFADFRDFYFQFDIPAKDVRYDVWIPSYFYYNIYLKGSKNIKEAPTSTAHNKKTDVSEHYRSFNAINVPAIKDEAYVDNIDNYRSTILHELAAVAMPNQPVKYYTSDWKAVAKTIYANEHFGWELRLSSYFENDIDPLLVKGMSDNDKLAVIFEFVKNRMNWNEELGYLCDAGVKKAYSEKTGNVAEINLMLTAMLRHAKLDANPVLVSTRANGVAPYPTRSAYNYVIAAVKLNDKTILLDATAKYTQPGIIPIRAINWEGRLIRRNGDTEQIDLTPAIVSKENVTVVCAMNPDGTITGKARDQYSDYNAYLFRDKYAGMQQDSYLEKLESKYKGISVNDYKVANDKDVTKPIVEDYNFTHDMITDVIGPKLYLSPMLFFKQNENPFRQETRLYPVDFVFPNYDKYAITIKIPDGYAISSLPKSAAISMAENMGSFKYNVQATDNNIQLLATFEIKDAKISSENYKTLKDFYQKMIEKQNEQIVLTKQ